MTERQNIEWKEIWKDDYLAWICGFANAQGGKLYIGMNDSGKVVGVKNAKKLLEDLPNKIRDAMGIIVNVNLLNEGDFEYIENQKLSGPELEAFIMRRRGVTWDSMPLPTFTIADVDDGVVKRFKQWAVNKGRINKSVLSEDKFVMLEKLHLVKDGYLTNAAMLLFSNDPEKWQLGAYVKIGFFETDSDLVYQDEIHGSILDQINKIVEIIYLKYMKAKISYVGMQRIERYFVPEEALREALLNALCHKDYSRGIPIQISIYNDKLYIANCGHLPESWTVENLFEKHASQPFNPNIAYVFYLAGFIESWGRGIEKICTVCKNDGVFQPEFTVHPQDIMIKFSAPEDRIVRTSTDRVTEKVTERVTEKVTEAENQLLALLMEDPAYTYEALSKKLKVSRKTIGGLIKSLKSKNIISRVGSDTKGYWQITLKN